MANQKSYRNQYNKSKSDVKSVEINAPVEEVVNSIEKEPVPIPVKHGIVDNCARLNVRMYPRTESKVLCILENGDEVEVHESLDPINFYKVMTDDGLVGFCVKDYITLLE